MQRKKEDIFIIVLALILVVIIFSVAAIALFAPPSSKKITKALPTISPTPTLEPGAQPNITYNGDAQNMLLDKMNNRVPLSQDDSFAKARILSLLPPGENSGVLYETKDIIIDYTESPDLFQGEILTPDVAQAKAITNVWFRARGMSQDGICNLPVMFYINYDVARHMRDSKIIFSPLPNGCL